MARIALWRPEEGPDFRRDVGDVIARLASADRAEGCLTPALLLSASLRRCGLDRDLEEACDELLVLRRALLQTAPLDAAHEPVPLVVGDRRQALLTLATYLDDLLDRAARAGGCRREEVVEAAVDWLER
jgi:hypothetical protein